jgi:ribosomal protein S20
MKDVAKAVAESKVSELPELLKKAYSMIDINLKKKLIKKNNAARKKSLMARMAKSASLKKKTPETTPVAP